MTGALRVTSTVWERLAAVRVRTAVFWTAVVVVEVSLVLAYLAVTHTRIELLRYTVIYPFVWINVALWVAHTARPIEAPRRIHLLMAGVALAYLVALLAIPGRLALDGGGFDAAVRWQVPGWGPIIGVELGGARLTIVPYEMAGYLALAYLVYLNLLRLGRSTLAGLLGLVTCVGCTVPVLVPVVGALGGVGATLQGAVFTWMYDLATIVYLVAIGVLYRNHRPSA